MVDLDAYFRRIGYHGPREPTLEVLRAILALHPAAIPFEAIDVLLDRGVDVSPAAVDDKLIARRRGGYCYEQNGLLLRVLTELGFEAEGRLARVLWNAPADAPPRGRTHMVLRVTIDGVVWLADVGFGSCVPTSPLRWDVREPQATAHEDFRLTPVGEDMLMEARLGEAWTPVYQVTPDRQLQVDYELSNWFSSTHPSSHFRHNLLVAKTTAEGRFGLLFNRLTIRRPDGTQERRELSADEIEQALADIFGLEVQPDWRPMIARAALGAP